MRKTLALVSTAALFSGCIPMPYFSSRAGLEPSVVPGRLAPAPLWKRRAFQPADVWNLLFSATWDSHDRAPDLFLRLAAPRGDRPELLALFPDGAVAVDPATGEVVKSLSAVTALRDGRIHACDDGYALSPPLSVRAAGGADAHASAWKAIGGGVRYSRVVCLPCGLLALGDGHLSLLAADGTALWSLEKTRGKLLDACQFGDLVVAGFSDPEQGYLVDAYAKSDGKFAWKRKGRLVGVLGDGVLVGPTDGSIALVGQDGKSQRTLDAHDAVPSFAPAYLPPASGAAGPAAVGHVAYAAQAKPGADNDSFDRLVGRSTGTGQVWQTDIKEPSRLSPVAVGGSLFVTLGAYFPGVADLGGAYETLQAYAPDDGALLYRITFPPGFLGVAASPDRLIVWTRDGWLRAYRLDPAERHG